MNEEGNTGEGRLIMILIFMRVYERGCYIVTTYYSYLLYIGGRERGGGGLIRIL